MPEGQKRPHSLANRRGRIIVALLVAATAVVVGILILPRGQSEPTVARPPRFLLYMRPGMVKYEHKLFGICLDSALFKPPMAIPLGTEKCRDFRTDGEWVVVWASGHDQTLRLLRGRLPSPEWKEVKPPNRGEVVDWTYHVPSQSIVLLCKTERGATLQILDEKDTERTWNLKGDLFLKSMVLSPNGRHLAIWVHEESKEAITLLAQLYLIDLQDGSARPTQLFAVDLAGGTYAGNIVWSPDSTRLIPLCVSMDQTGRTRTPWFSCIVDVATLNIQPFEKGSWGHGWIDNSSLLIMDSKKLSVRRTDGRILRQLGSADSVVVFPGTATAAFCSYATNSVEMVDLIRGLRTPLPPGDNETPAPTNPPPSFCYVSSAGKL